ncbi:hypothetical protein [Planobispora takensis]|uniref:hypothetical protein n=1 Tax=Planobispora takensis TaxID=1367882 RepID=UPI001943B3EC|nr:hypothetical protein [Planobispora takensis]
MAVAGTRRLAAAGAAVAFTVGGVGMAAGVGTATAQTAAARGPAVAATCEEGVAVCESQPGSPPSEGDPWAEGHGSGPSLGGSEPGESFSGDPEAGQSGQGDWPEPEAGSDETFASIPLPRSPGESWSAAPGETFSSGPASLPPSPWKPAGEHKVPRGAPQTGAGGLAAEPATWPFAAGGGALLIGAGLAGYAVRRRRAGEA